jgi:PAS domain S-box-containing protein
MFLWAQVAESPGSGCILGVSMEASTTRRKRIKEAAQPAEATAFDALDDAVCTLDLEGRILACNRTLAELLGKDKAELPGRPLLPLLKRCLDGQDGAWLQGWEDLEERKTAEVHAGSRCFRHRMTPLAGPDGGLKGAVYIISDITRQKRAECALQNSEQMAAVGRLAGTLAHEINNPVAAVSNALFLLERSPDLDATSREYVDMARQELQRLSQVVRKTLGFYRETRRPVPVGLAEVLDDVLDLYARQIQAGNVAIHRHYEFTGTVPAFPAELRFVLGNVVQNALDAVDAGGSITLRVARSRDWRDPQRTGVRVVIADNGSGIAPEHRRRVLEPFFTTKGESSGLGLWVADRIVEKHRGRLQLRSGVSRDGRGLVVCIFLPDHPEGRRPPARRQSAGAIRQRAGAAS